MRKVLLISVALATSALLEVTPAATGQPARMDSIGGDDTIRVRQGSCAITVQLACNC